MKVLKHLQSVYTCEHCGCEFELEGKDSLYPYTSDYQASCYCPDCGCRMLLPFHLPKFDKATFGEVLTDLGII